MREKKKARTVGATEVNIGQTVVGSGDKLGLFSKVFLKVFGFGLLKCTHTMKRARRTVGEKGGILRNNRNHLGRRRN